MKRQCPHCRKRFVPKEKSRPSTFCSRQCCGKAHSKQTPVSCSTCGKEFLRKQYHVQMSGRRGHFCCHRCYAKWQSLNMRGPANHAWKDRIVLECHQCSRAFSVEPHKQHRQFCSRKCFQDWRSVDYPSPSAFYNSLWDRNRRLALERDGHACVHCGRKDCSLVVHHKRRLRDLLAEAARLAHELDNLETACEECHGRQHSPRVENRRRTKKAVPS